MGKPWENHGKMVIEWETYGKFIGKPMALHGDLASGNDCKELERSTICLMGKVTKFRLGHFQ